MAQIRKMEFDGVIVGAVVLAFELVCNWRSLDSRLR